MGRRKRDSLNGERQKAGRTMIRITIAALLFLFASALRLSAAPPSPQPSPVPSPWPSTERQTEQPKATNTNSQANPQPAEASPTATQIVPSSKLKAKSDDSGENSNYEQRQYGLNVLLTWFNGILAAFTVFLVLVGAYQGYQLRRTVQETKVAADAAKKSADVAEMTLLRDRPILIVIDHGMGGFHAPVDSVRGVEQADPKAGVPCRSVFDKKCGRGGRGNRKRIGDG